VKILEASRLPSIPHIARIRENRPLKYVGQKWAWHPQLEIAYEQRVSANRYRPPE
jgi:hypothetical protein